MTTVFARRFCAIRLPNSTKKGIISFGEFIGFHKAVPIVFYSVKAWPEPKVFFLSNAISPNAFYSYSSSAQTKRQGFLTRAN